MKSKTTLSPREAANRLGITLNAVYAMLWAGKIEAEMRQNRWYISAAAVENRLARKTQAGSAVNDPVRQGR